MSDVATGTINILGLCSGLGWLEFAAAEAFRARGARADVVCHCEREATTAVLLARLQNATGHQAPIWDDIATFDGHPWRGVVDCVTAGLPCPAYSVAGKRTGNDDERAWGQDGDGPQYHALRIIGEILPEFVFLENVPQFVSGGHFRRLGEGLLGLGYRIPPAIYLSAGDVGATQERERVFVLAYREKHRSKYVWTSDAKHGNESLTRSQSMGLRTRRGQRTNGRTQGHAGHVDESDRTVGGAVGVERREGLQGKRPERRTAISGASTELGDGAGAGFQAESIPRLPAHGSDGLGLYPPGRGYWTDPEWQRVIRLDASSVPATEPGFSMVVNGLAVAASDLLRIGGNGVVPMAAAVALDVLLAEIGLLP